MLEFIFEFLFEIVLEGAIYCISKLFKYRIVKIIMLSILIVGIGVLFNFIFRKLAI